jgi:GNAT superfamily N-acetyltransferase
VRLRLATIDDEPSLAANFAAGFETYREFAPAGWNPPKVPVRQEFRRPGAWIMVGEEHGGVVGHVMFGPAMSSRFQDAKPIPGLAHLYHLFVRQSFWGTGLATQLLNAAVEEMEAQGYTQARLFAPAQQARARRFYAREGWTLAAEPRHEPALGIGVVELRRWIGE